MQQEELDFPVTANTVIPIDKDSLATSKELRNLSKRGSDNFVRILRKSIKVRPGFNGRTKDNPGFSRESLEELARSIIRLGLLAPLKALMLKTGEAMLIEGERRLLSINIIVEWIESGNLKEFIIDGKTDIPDFEYIECLIAPKNYSENDYILAMATENMARQNFTPMEEAEIYMRLKINGLSAADIAKAVPGLSPMQVSNRLRLAGLSNKEKELIEEGKLSPTAAVKLASVVEDAEERIGIIEDAAQGEDGKLKVNDILERIADNEANENPANLVDEDEADNPLRNGDLVDPIKSGADDDPSMKGTSPKAKPDAKINGDPAVKSVDQPEVEGDFDDEVLKSGTKTAFDLTLKVMAELKEMEGILGRDADARLVTLISSMERKLYDIKVILKIKKKK